VRHYVLVKQVQRAFCTSKASTFVPVKQVKHLTLVLPCHFLCCRLTSFCTSKARIIVAAKPSKASKAPEAGLRQPSLLLPLGLLSYFLFSNAVSDVEDEASTNVSIREHTSEYVSIREHTPAYASIRQHTQHTPAYASIRQRLHLCAQRCGG
jgi:hypothetical protein